jgi:hypothetical protein
MEGMNMKQVLLAFAAALALGLSAHTAIADQPLRAHVGDAVLHGSANQADLQPVWGWHRPGWGMGGYHRPYYGGHYGFYRPYYHGFYRPYHGFYRPYYGYYYGGYWPYYNYQPYYYYGYYW